MLPSVELHLAKDVSLPADCVLFWRASAGDGVYGPGGNVVRDPEGSSARFIGTQPSLIATWRVDPHATISATCTRFEPGKFLDETGPHRAVDYVRLEVTLRF